MARQRRQAEGLGIPLAKAFRHTGIGHRGATRADAERRGQLSGQGGRAGGDAQGIRARVIEKGPERVPEGAGNHVGRGAGRVDGSGVQRTTQPAFGGGVIDRCHPFGGGCGGMDPQGRQGLQIRRLYGGLQPGGQGARGIAVIGARGGQGFKPGAIDVNRHVADDERRTAGMRILQKGLNQLQRECDNYSIANLFLLNAGVGAAPSLRTPGLPASERR